jgi:type IX secretion system PorP/SprF family membrane protein
MKRLLFITSIILLTSSLSGQQFPFMDGYNVDPFRLSPSFTGLGNQNTILVDARSDWTGIPGGPKTYQLGYHGRFFEKVGLGGRFVYDKTDIFKQMMFMGTYSYEVPISESHLLNFALSAGIYSNSIDLGAYYNDPDFVIDPVLLNSSINSKIKFVTDISALYRFDNLEAGVLFSNLMFGPATYNEIDLSFNPKMNYLIHASYKYHFDETWSVKPFLLYRGGMNAPDLIEVMAHLNYTSKIWGNLLFRSSGVWGLGFGGEVYNGITLNYSYNMSHNVALNTFGGHQVSLGFRLDLIKGNVDSTD